MMQFLVYDSNHQGNCIDVTEEVTESTLLAMSQHAENRNLKAVVARLEKQVETLRQQSDELSREARDFQERLNKEVRLNTQQRPDQEALYRVRQYYYRVGRDSRPFLKRSWVVKDLGQALGFLSKVLQQGIQADQVEEVLELTEEELVKANRRY